MGEGRSMRAVKDSRATPDPAGEELDWHPIAAAPGLRQAAQSSTTPASNR